MTDTRTDPGEAARDESLPENPALRCRCRSGGGRAIAMSAAALEDLVVVTGQPRLQAQLDAFLGEASAALTALTRPDGASEWPAGRRGSYGT